MGIQVLLVLYSLFGESQCKLVMQLFDGMGEFNAMSFLNGRNALFMM